MVQIKIANLQEKQIIKNRRSEVRLYARYDTSESLTAGLKGLDLILCFHISQTDETDISDIMLANGGFTSCGSTLS